MKKLACSVLVCVLAGLAAARAGQVTPPKDAKVEGESRMQLGNFSVSLAVKDLAASREFYEKLGFTQVGGNGKNWIILKNENTKIGLFQGMFEKNTLTFNPGWTGEKETLAEFQDVRDLQKALKAKGLTPTVAADESSTGPAFFMLTDPDGNPVLVDQHVPKPAK